MACDGTPVTCYGNENGWYEGVRVRYACEGVHVRYACEGVHVRCACEGVHVRVLL